MLDPNANPASTLTSPGFAVSTQEPATVYDGGRRAVSLAKGSAVTSATTLLVVPASGGNRVKLLGGTIIIPVFTTAGSASLTDGITNFYDICRVTAAGQNFHFPPTGLIMVQTAVGTPLYIYFDGNAHITASFIYYYAP